MLVDYTNQRRAAGETIRTALIQPTTLVCAYFDDNNRHGFGMFPIALALEQVPNGKTDWHG
jgi:HAE1 family hydrophobic/amphiphilic exporter-1